jgi:polar amino acid transport system substrate-binding protein
MFKMERRLKIFISAFLIFFLATATFGEKQKLIFDTQDFAPFSYTEKNKVAGPGADIIALVCKEMGVDYEIRLLPWARAQLDVKNGEAHALFFIGKNKEREEWLEFGMPIINTEYGFFVNREDKLQYKEIKDLANYTIGVYGPSNTATTLMNALLGATNIKVEMTPDDIAAFRKLNIKRVGAVFSNVDVGKSMIKELKLENVRYAGMYSALQYYIGFSKKMEHKELSDKFYGVLSELQKSGEIKKILDKYDMQ